MKHPYFVRVLSSSIGLILALLFVGAIGGASANQLAQSAVGIPTARSDVNGPESVPVSSTFTYQGRLANNGTPVTGTCSLGFRLFDDPSTGNLVGSPITMTNVSMVDGYFSAGLNFGSDAFSGSARWLDIRVNCGSGFTVLSPRQPVTAAPYALYASNVNTATIQSRVSGACAGGNAIRVINTNGTVTCEAVSGGGSGWSLTGNSGTNPTTNFVGTTDNVTLTARVNNVVGWRLAPSGANTPNVIGGYSGNTVPASVAGATIGGGGASGALNSVTANYATIGGGVSNSANNFYAAIGGGQSNSASGQYATVSGGYNGHATFDYAFVGGGANNTASKQYATVGGGYNNVASGLNGFVGGGYNNTASGLYDFVGGGNNNAADGITSTVVGGWANDAGGNASFIGGGVGNATGVTGDYATIGGGEYNIASGLYATIGGGQYNTASGIAAVVGGGGQDAYNWYNGNHALGDASTIGGGAGNTASFLHATIGGGANNLASGEDATVGGGASNTASFGWATVGGGGSNTASSIDATVGGGTFNTASGEDATVPGGYKNVASGFYSFAAGRNAHATHNGSFVWEDMNVGIHGPYGSSADNQFTVYATGGVQFITGLNFSTGVETGGCSLAANSGSWNCTSDRNVKANFQDVDPRDVLARVNKLPIQSWKYVGQDDSVRHIGPMAQDFYATFGVGDDNRHIGMLDEGGVAFAAIQGLSQVMQDKDARIAAQQKQIDSLESRITALEQAVQTNNVGSHSNSTGNVALIVIAVLLGIVVVRRPWQGGQR